MFTSGSKSGNSIYFLILSKLAPIMGKRTIKKENFAAFSLLTPKTNAIAIVDPDRDIPGKMAIDCANQITKDFPKVTSPIP